MYQKFKIFILSFLFLFLTSPVKALDCSTTEGCYRPGAGIAGPDCSCPWIDGGDNSRCIEGGCPQVVDCQWSEWSECSVNCGGGIQTRTIKTEAQGGGEQCIGSFQQTCNTNPCPWRRGECDTDIGEYSCTQVGQNEETEGQTIYETEGECREDTENQCIKNISDEVEKVMGDCWGNKKIYNFTSRVSPAGRYAVGDVNNDGYNDIVSLRDDGRDKFLEILKNIRKEDGTFDRLSIGGTEVFPYGGESGMTYLINVGNYGEENKNRVIAGRYSFYSVNPSFWIKELNTENDWKEIDSVNEISTRSGYMFQGVKNVDLDGDGQLDMIIPLAQSAGQFNEARWFRLQGSGDNSVFSGSTSYKKAVNFYGTYERNVIDFGDFWGNGKKGVVWVSDGSTNGRVSVYANKNNLLFDSIDIMVPNVSIRTVSAGDFNGDGLDDIVVGGVLNNYDGAFVEIYEAKIVDDELKFEKAKGFGLKTVAIFTSIISTDFNNDGIKDVVAVDKQGSFCVITGDRNSNYGISDPITTSDEENFDITVANFDNVGGDDFVIFTPSSALVYLNKCTPSGASTCNTCEGKEGDKSKGDANCDGKVDLADFEAWRGEYFDGENKDNWKADFNCSKELSKPDLSDFNIWRTSYFGV